MRAHPPHLSLVEPASGRARWCPIDVDAWCARERGALRTGLRALGDLIDEASAIGAHRLHIETDGDDCRIRLRGVDGLVTRRAADGAPLIAALERIADAARSHHSPRLSVLWQAGTVAPRLLSLDTLRVVEGASWHVSLLAHPRQAPTLDELVADHERRDRIDGALERRSGLIVLTGRDPHALTPLATALAQRCIAPDRKVLRIEAFARHPLPGALQIELDALAPERRLATCRAMFAHDADVIVADAVLPDSANGLLDALSAERLVIRVLPGQPGRELAGLRAGGAHGAWLAEHLLAIVRLDEIRQLCEHCRTTVPRLPVSDVLSDADRLLALSLAGIREASGCANCHGSGIGAITPFVDACAPDDGFRSSLRDERFEPAQAQVDATRHAAIVAARLARTGCVSLAEVARLERRDD